jgi:hypothetical protein
MSLNFQELIEKYHAHYEVLPYYVLVEEKHGSRKDKIKNRIQSGFDVDVYGISDKDAMELPPAPDYSVGYAEVKKIADTVPRTSECSIEVIPFPSTAIVDASRKFRPQAVIRIRISHSGDVEQPAGFAERRALDQIEKQLQGQGITRR